MIKYTPNLIPITQHEIIVLAQPTSAFIFFTLSEMTVYIWHCIRQLDCSEEYPILINLRTTPVNSDNNPCSACQDPPTKHKTISTHFRSNGVENNNHTLSDRPIRTLMMGETVFRTMGLQFTRYSNNSHRLHRLFISFQPAYNLLLLVYTT